MLDIILRGGPVMIPLIICSVAALAIALERIWYLFRTRVEPDDLMDDVESALGQGKVLEAMQAAKQAGGAVGSIVSTGIALCDRSQREIHEQMSRAGELEIFKMQRRMIWLETIVSVAPLLGLLGTVTGIIDSFQVLDAMQGVNSASGLSSGIAEALITTATGLAIAIPTMAAYSYLVSIIDRRIASMNRVSAELLEVFSQRGEV